MTEMLSADVSSCLRCTTSTAMAGLRVSRGTSAAAERHQLQSRGHLRGGLAFILTPSPTSCDPACSRCPGMPRTSAKSCFSQECPRDEGILRKPSISSAEPEAVLERLARDWTFNTLGFISLDLFPPFHAQWVFSL